MLCGPYTVWLEYQTDFRGGFDIAIQESSTTLTIAVETVLSHCAESRFLNWSTHLSTHSRRAGSNYSLTRQHCSGLVGVSRVDKLVRLMTLALRRRKVIGCRSLVPNPGMLLACFGELDLQRQKSNFMQAGSEYSAVFGACACHNRSWSKQVSSAIDDVKTPRWRCDAPHSRYCTKLRATGRMPKKEDAMQD